MLIPEQYGVVIVGATGWMGRATIEYFRRVYGDAILERIWALGSRARTLPLANGGKVNVQSLDSPKIPNDLPVLLFHYAFLTKDKVAGRTEHEYVSANMQIRDGVAALLKHLDVKGFFMPSSGAVYRAIEGGGANDETLYGNMKLEDEGVFCKLAKARNIPCVIPRVFNTAGPFINKFEHYALAAFIVDCVKQNHFRINADIGVWRSYYDVSDIIELGINLLMSELDGCCIFDTVGAEIVEIGELAQRVVRLVGDKNTRVTRPYVKSAKFGESYYVGRPDAIREYERKFHLNPLTLDAQILETAAYIRSELGA